jgi:hypothetical protein
MAALAKTPEASSGSDEGEEGGEPKTLSLRKSPAKTADPAASGGASYSGRAQDPSGPKVLKPRAKDYPKAHALATRIIENDDLPDDAEAEIRAMSIKERNRFKRWAVKSGWAE